MLSGKLATLLSSRYIENPIYPLSFKEFLHGKGIAEDSRYVDQAYLEYEKYGGFPINIKDNYQKILMTGRYYENNMIDGIAVVYIADWLLK